MEVRVKNPKVLQAIIDNADEIIDRTLLTLVDFLKEKVDYPDDEGDGPPQIEDK